jgi:hypothetical protein
MSRWLANSELEGMWKEVAVTHYWVVPEWNEDNQAKA